MGIYAVKKNGGDNNPPADTSLQPTANDGAACVCGRHISCCSEESLTELKSMAGFQLLMQHQRLCFPENQKLYKQNISFAEPRGHRGKQQQDDFHPKQ